MAQGKLHVEILGEGADFPGDKGAGMQIFVEKVKKAINVRFQGSPHPPKTLFVDCGPGFWATNSGKITGAFKQALAQHRLMTYYGGSAAIQPGEMQEIMLHETAVSWIRYRETRNRMIKPWEETVEQFEDRMKSIVQNINDNLDVDGLCRALPARIEKLVQRDGGRINT